MYCSRRLLSARDAARWATRAAGTPFSVPPHPPPMHFTTFSFETIFSPSFALPPGYLFNKRSLQMCILCGDVLAPSAKGSRNHAWDCCVSSPSSLFRTPDSGSSESPMLVATLFLRTRPRHHTSDTACWQYLALLGWGVRAEGLRSLPFPDPPRVPSSTVGKETGQPDDDG